MAETYEALTDAVFLPVPTRDIPKAKFLDQVLLIGHFMLVQATYATRRF
jgi:hypothetical protein